MNHKRVNQIILVIFIGLLAFYFIKNRVDPELECQNRAGIWNEVTKTCVQTTEQIIYESLATAHPLSINYPESDVVIRLHKKEVIKGSEYLRGHYEELLQEESDQQQAVYDRGSVYLNISKMVLLSEAETGLLYFSAPFVVNRAGSGVFVYVGLFSFDLQSKQGEHLDSFLLGDRIREEKIYSIKDFIQIDFKEHAAEQGYADYPSKLATLSLQLLNLFDENKKARFKEVKRMHHSWDKNQDGLNDCESDGSCDHTVDYTIPRGEQL